jgi:tetratricopeptide (TPR) repeat protein
MKKQLAHVVGNPSGEIQGKNVQNSNFKFQGLKKMEKKELSEAGSLKEAGNTCYKDNDVSGALDNYTKAIEICDAKNDRQLLAICLKNRAAVFLKNEDFEDCIKDCTQALDLVPNDPKSLFRRCQAHEALKQVDSAYKDARDVQRVDSKNSAIGPILIRLQKAVLEPEYYKRDLQQHKSRPYKIVKNETVSFGR